MQKEREDIFFRHVKGINYQNQNNNIHIVFAITI